MSCLVQCQLFYKIDVDAPFFKGFHRLKKNESYLNVEITNFAEAKTDVDVSTDRFSLLWRYTNKPKLTVSTGPGGLMD